MRYIACILILIFINCKNETKTENGTQTERQAEVETQSNAKNGMDTSVFEMWNNYLKLHPEFKDEQIPDTEFFHNNREDANRLTELTLSGKKKAFSGLFSLYKQYKVDLPKIGTKQIITDYDGKAKVIIENISVDTIPFNKIPKSYAELDMGTDVKALEKWKKAHWNFFENFLKQSGAQPTEEMLIVCVRFKTIWPEKN